MTACLMPALAALLLVSFGLRAWVFLGRRPEMYNPDPADLPFLWHYDLVAVALVFALYAIVALPILHRPFPSITGRFRRLWYLVAGIGFVLLVIAMNFFGGWFLD